MANDLEQKIINQIEYYFGDVNLARDKFLQEKIKEDEGWVSLDVLLTFKRLASLSTDPAVISEAIKKSEKKFVVVSEDNTKLRRSPDEPVPEFNEEYQKSMEGRTAYAKGFPLTEELDSILKFLEAHGNVVSCTRRTYLDKVKKERLFKGSCFIVFKDEESCKKFIESESVKFNETELIRKWAKDYNEEKKKEIEERKKNKNDRKNKQAEKAAADKNDKKFDFPKGACLHFVIKEGKDLTREDIKDKLKELGEIEQCFVDFSKGDSKGHVRLNTENAAIEFNKLLTDGKLEIGEVTLEVKVLEGEEEDLFLKKSLEDINKQRQKSKFNSRQNRKRKGNFGQGGHNKRNK